MKTTTERVPKLLLHAPHVGTFIRAEVFPEGLTVKDAAAHLGVSRVALSNLVNGNADLSGEMALRLEKAFGVSMDLLLRWQANYIAAQTRQHSDAIDVVRVPARAAQRVRPTRPDDENPEWTAEMFAHARPLKDAAPAVYGALRDAKRRRPR